MFSVRRLSYWSDLICGFFNAWIFLSFFVDSINIICTSQGINPHITYSFEESEDFVIINGFLFLVNDLTDDTFRLTVRLRKIEHHKPSWDLSLI